MGPSLLVNLHVEAGAELIERLAPLVAISAAYWIKEAEREYKHLYIACEQFDGEGKDAAYLALHRVMQELRNPNLTRFSPSLTGVTNPTARAIIELQRDNPRRLPIWLEDQMLGRVYIDYAYVYPPPVPHTQAARA